MADNEYSLEYWQQQYQNFVTRHKEIEDQISTLKELSVGSAEKFEKYKSENEQYEADIRKIMEEAKTHIEGLQYKGMPDHEIENKIIKAQIILRKLWDMAKELKDKREKILKECQNHENQAKSFSEQCEPIVKETLDNASKTSSNSRLLKRNILHYECQQFSNKMESDIKILQEKTTKLNSSTQSKILSAKLITQEAQAKALYLKRELLTSTDPTEQYNLAFAIQAHCNYMNESLLPLIPNYEPIIANSQNIANSLYSDANRIIELIKKYISGFTVLEQVYSGVLGITDKVLLEQQYLQYQYKETANKKGVINSERDAANEKIQEYSKLYEDERRKIETLKKRLDDERKLSSYTENQLQYLIENESRVSAENANRSQSDTLSESAEKLVNCIHKFMNSQRLPNMPANAGVSQDFVQKFAELKASVNQLLSNQQAQRSEKQRLERAKKRIDFAEELKEAKIQIYNPELISIYDPDTIDIEHNSKEFLLQIMGGAPGALTEALFNPYVKELLYSTIFLLYLCYTDEKPINILQHFANIQTFVAEAQKGSTLQLYENIYMDKYYVRKYPLPDFPAPDFAFVLNTYNSYIHNWLVFNPSVFNTPDARNIMELIKKFVQENTTNVSDDIVTLLSCVDAPEKLIRTEAAPPAATKDGNDVEACCQDFMIKAFKIYLGINARDFLSYTMRRVQEKGDDYHTRIMSLRRELQTLIYTTVASDKKGKLVLLQWYHAAVDAIKKYNNHELFSAISDAIKKMPEEWVESNTKKYAKEKLQDLANCRVELQTALDEFEKVKLEVKGTMVPCINIFEKRVSEIGEEYLKKPPFVQMRAIAPIVKSFFSAKRANIKFVMPVEDMSKIIGHYPKTITEEDLMSEKKKKK